MPGIYQLVFQLRGSSESDFEEMVGLEEELTSAIGDLGEVDGHDVGQDEMNIFVHTPSPIRLFEAVRSLPAVARAMPRLRVAFRPLDGDQYEVLHPPGSYRFTVA
ncbi:MAG TPA: hypothetical protein VGS01_07800 [Candidatus Limnocylindria bacterium]|nr:hypothetical protein [Candidatus Limnocylindria bacterium]